jgi:hypothetical protein
MGMDDLVWERCTRLLLTNKITELREFSCTLTKILTNIIDSPTNEKFLRLKLSNPTLKQKIFDINGGLDILLACGFEHESEESILSNAIDHNAIEKSLIFPILPLLRLEQNAKVQQKIQKKSSSLGRCLCDPSFFRLILLYIYRST